MKLLDNEFERYNDLGYEKIHGTRFRMRDEKLGKEMDFNLNGMDVSKYLPWRDFIKRLESMNDFLYTVGYGFYLTGYAEFGLGGWLAEGGCETFEKGKTYRFEHYEFQVSAPSDMFHYFTWPDDESKIDELETIKLTGVEKESFVIDIEKALLYLGTHFEANFEEEYAQFLYPHIIDLREVGMSYEPFDYTVISTELDWRSSALRNIGLFNEGESTDNYNFFPFYRFIETFFGKGREEDQLIELVESIDTTELIKFATKHKIINDNSTAKSLARELYAIRNSYVHHKLKRVRMFDPTHNIPTPILLKWRVIAKEIAIQLLNSRGRLQV